MDFPLQFSLSNKAVHVGHESFFFQNIRIKSVSALCATTKCLYDVVSVYLSARRTFRVFDLMWSKWILRFGLRSYARFPEADVTSESRMSFVMEKNWRIGNTSLLSLLDSMGVRDVAVDRSTMCVSTIAVVLDVTTAFFYWTKILRIYL